VEYSASFLQPVMGQKHRTQAKEDESKKGTRPPFRGKRPYHHVSSRDQNWHRRRIAKHKNYWRQGNQYTSGVAGHNASATFSSGAP
jgi:hypothetical protein